MRMLALMAFVALQLSVFTCGFNIHVHAMDADLGHVAEHSHDENDKHQPDTTDHACHVHASHAFATSDVKQHKNTALFSTAHHYVLADPGLKNIPLRIEHPPKLQHS